MPAFIELEDQKFGRLTAIRRSGTNQSGGAIWLCKCSCNGLFDLLEVRAGHLRSGHTKSCGCLQLEAAAVAAMTHGHHRRDWRSEAYQSWRSMKARCSNPKHKYWKHYGGRGIAVCERWQSFENFLADMGERPPGKTLDRYPDNDGNYEPGNCRWATRKEQAANRRAP